MELTYRMAPSLLEQTMPPPGTRPSSTPAWPESLAALYRTLVGSPLGALLPDSYCGGGSRLQELLEAH